jgi:hypothetical protein
MDVKRQREETEGRYIEEEMEGRRQRGIDTGEETEGGDIWEEKHTEAEERDREE